MVAATFFAVLTQRQESQIGSDPDFLIGWLSLGAYCIIYTDILHKFSLPNLRPGEGGPAIASILVVTLENKTISRAPDGWTMNRGLLV